MNVEFNEGKVQFIIKCVSCGYEFEPDYETITYSFYAGVYEEETIIITCPSCDGYYTMEDN